MSIGKKPWWLFKCSIASSYYVCSKGVLNLLTQMFHIKTNGCVHQHSPTRFFPQKLLHNC